MVCEVLFNEKLNSPKVYWTINRLLLVRNDNTLQNRVLIIFGKNDLMNKQVNFNADGGVYFPQGMDGF